MAADYLMLRVEREEEAQHAAHTWHGQMVADVKRFAHSSETIASNASSVCFAADNGVNVYERKEKNAKKRKPGNSNPEVTALGLGRMRMSFGVSPFGDKQAALFASSGALEVAETVDLFKGRHGDRMSWRLIEKPVGPRW